MQLEYPILFSGNGNNVSGTIDFRLGIQIDNSYSKEENKNKWYFKIIKADDAIITNY